MTRTSLVLLALAGVGACVGCERDFYARRIVEYDTTPGRLLLDLTGTGHDLAQTGRIDLHREITGANGTPIDVWVLSAHPTATAEGTRGTAVLLHGITESKAAYLGAAEQLSRKGYDVVLPDLRAHGRSGGEYVTYGALESRDVKAVMDLLIGAGTVDEKVVVFGTTLGATTAIQYAAIDQRVQGVLALTPYKDAAAIARRRIALSAPAMGIEDFQTVLDRAGEIAEFNPAEASSVEAARVMAAPLHLVHGLLDVWVPLEHSKAIYKAAPGPKKLTVVTPGPEQVALAVAMESWIAEKLDQLARVGLPAEE